MATKPGHVSTEDFDKIFQSVCNWGRWGADDEKGTLNYITPEHVREASSLVKSGRTVSLSIPINKTAGPDNPHPALHYITHNHDIDIPQGEPHFVLDFLASECHGDCHSHMDALCHVSYKGRLYNDKPISYVTSRGPEIYDITTYAHSIVGRGVLFDIPRLRNVKWLEPGEAVTAKELEEAEKAQGVRLGEGDIFLSVHVCRCLESKNCCGQSVRRGIHGT